MLIRILVAVFVASVLLDVAESTLSASFRAPERVKANSVRNRRMTSEPISSFVLPNGTTSKELPHLAPIYKVFRATRQSNNATCDMCVAGVKFLSDIVETYGGPWLIEKIVPVCDVIWPWIPQIIHSDYCDVHIENECRDLCVGMIKSWGGVVAQVISATFLKPELQCERIKACPATNTTFFPIYPKTVVESAGKPVQGKLTSILHITDIHVDANYEVGAITDCKMPVCCHSTYGKGTPGAGVFGDYTCDSPQVLVEASMNEVRLHKPDHIIFTGDAPAHDLWLQTHESNVYSILNVTQWTLKAAKDAGNTKFWPALGNHAGAPVDEFGGPLKDFWLYGPVGDAWSSFLPASAIVSFKWGGYYTAVMEPGLHVISLQTNYYDTNNLFLPLADHWDMAGQLTWLQDVLRQIEALGEKAIVIAHEKPGSFRDGKWPNVLMKLFSQYAHILPGLFFGHNHNDMYHVMTATADSPVAKIGEPAGVFYVPSSLTPIERSTNPSYRVYKLDSGSHTVLDFSQFRFDLDDANKAGYVKWYQAYTARSLFGLKDLSPASWMDAGKRMITNSTLWKAFAMNFHGGVKDPSPDTVDSSAQAASCFVTTASSSQYGDCMKKAGAVVGDTQYV